MYYHNPSLREEPRDQPPVVLPSSGSLSILDWLRQEGRLLEQPMEVPEITLDEDLEEIDDLIGDNFVEDFEMEEEE
ncbi:DUF3134 family protein [Synechococcus sp. H65.1]|uniref:DUF3134 family protein n=1 Tax=unclassified Synechococcus TaxID=2626047 RepID=UPI0039C2EBF8